MENNCNYNFYLCESFGGVIVLNKEDFLTMLEKGEEINPHEYDGSYKLVQETLKKLAQTEKEKLDYKDLDMLFSMTLGTWASGYDRKKEKIRNSNLEKDDKDDLAELIDKVQKESSEGKYFHDNSNIGMFGAAFHTFKKGDGKPSQDEVANLIELFFEVYKTDNEDKCINKLENYIKDYSVENIYNFGLGSLSQILHCLRPRVFPVLNSKGKETYNIISDIFDFELETPFNISNYSDNVRRIKEFRNKNFDFKNYRVIDKYWSNIIEDSEKEKVSNELENEISENLSQDEKDEPVTYWRMIPGERAEQWDDFYERNYIAIGWPKLNYEKGALEKQIEAKYPNRNTNHIKTQFKHFIEEMSTGDIVVIYGNGKILNVAEVTGEWHFNPEEEHYKNKRDVEWLLDKPKDAAEYGEEFYNILSHRYTLFEIDDPEYIDIIENQILKKEDDGRKKNYFWVTANPKRWSVDEIRHGKEVFYRSTNDDGTSRVQSSAFEKAENGDKVLFYETSPIRAITATGEIQKGLHKEKKKGEMSKGITIKHIEDIGPISWQTLVDDDELKQTKPIKINAQGTLFEIDETEFNRILSLENVTPIMEVEIPGVDFDINLEQEKLYFEDEERLFQRLKTSLKNGKHIILTGPPGTGKSKLAKEIVENYVGNNYEMVTATSDWSTFDTIGGYKPDREGKLSFSSGVFLECFKDEENNPRNFWLVIDEINRADIDKAFGSLFSALTGDPITLSFKSENGKNIRIKPQENEKIKPTEHTYVIPEDWRIVATMNTFDKTSLYEMSYAFMRRFAFIPVSVPKDIDEDLLDKYIECWDIEKKVNLSQIAELWSKINEVRKIGPAIIKDIIEYLIDNEKDYSSAIITFVLPQFEGKRKDELKSFKDDLAEVSAISDDDVREIWEFAEDYFQLESD